MTKFIQAILAAKLDGFDIFLALMLGAAESYWFNGGAWGTLVYQLIAIAVFKSVKVAIDRHFSKTMV